MIMIAMLALTALHPGWVFRGGKWEQSEWHLKTRKGEQVGKVEGLEKVGSDE